MPILPGDTRKISEADRKKIRQWTDFMEHIEKKHGIMLYRQDLAGFGEPQEGAWDGFHWINTETGSGGFVGVFRQGAAESSRTVTVKYLKPTATYSILSFPDDKEFGKLTGKELLEKNRGVVCNPIVVRSAPANAVKYAKAIIDKI